MNPTDTGLTDEQRLAYQSWQAREHERLAEWDAEQRREREIDKQITAPFNTNVLERERDDKPKPDGWRKWSREDRREWQERAEAEARAEAAVAASYYDGLDLDTDDADTTTTEADDGGDHPGSIG